MEEPERSVDRYLRDLDRITDPGVRAQMASSMIHRLGVLTTRVATTRGQALIALRQQGHGATDIGRMIGTSRQQAHRLLRDAVGRDYEPVD
jgi:hypothetical protein